MGLTSKILRNEKFCSSCFAYLRRRASGWKLDAPPVFVVGCGHSGTSVLLRILGAHSRIYAVPYESRVFMHSGFKKKLARMVWSRDAIAHGKRRWVEKTPGHVRYIKDVFSDYPDAKVLVVVRDGRDVAVSFRKRFGEFEKGLQRWVADNQAAEEWKDHPNVMSLTYEQLVKDSDAAMAKVCEFIGEPFEETMFSFHEKPMEIFSQNATTVSENEGQNHNQFRNWQINQKLFDGSGKWMAEMTAAEKAQFKPVAGDMLIAYGYASDNEW
ncbi:sulfotransferase family protein [Pontiella sulfatireligans]|uniref:Sulfotransferase domain-containing protein n=1 Tax=Pontiella sulfatireligans TaxID=2750658 RepID=A0A6C2UL87_9BACT|nr:sulfotransferase [Pontiella sulfatireligans]VGO21002.1 hypothetical protein SCARR_03071 [Pontiella sulfatireligans]